VESLSNIDRKGTYEDLVEPLPLMKFLSTSSMNYYSYVGSLTTPPCAEKIIWIDYQEPIDLSGYQVNIYICITCIYIYRKYVHLTDESLSETDG